MKVSVLNFLHYSRTVLETDLVCGTHFISGGSLAHAVEYLVEYIDLFLAQQIFKRYALRIQPNLKLPSNSNDSCKRFYKRCFYSCKIIKLT